MNTESFIRVTHIASGDLWAGAEAQLYTLVKSLNRLPDIKCSVILLNHGMLEQKLKQLGIEVQILDETKLNGWQIYRRLIQIFKKTRTQVIHTHRQKENILGSFAGLFAGRIPSLRTQHGAAEHSPAWYHLAKHLVLFLDWFSGRYIQNKIIAVSEPLEQLLASSFPANKISVITNGIDIEILPKTLDRKKPDTIKIGLIGRLTQVKRVDLFLQAAVLTRQQCPEKDISFHVYGDGPLMADMQKLAGSLSLEDIVHFEGHRDDILQQMLSLDVLVMPSDHEGLPMTLLEAMVLHTPIVAHAVGGIPNLLDEGSCGLLIENHTAQGYNDGILKLLTDEQLSGQLTTMARARVEQHFSAALNASRYLEQYRKLVN